MRDALDAVSRPATLCAFCPKMCRFACPVSEAEQRETVTPWAKMSLVYLAREGEAALSGPDETKALEACTGCGACVEQCAHGNPVAETLFVSRSLARSPRSERYRAAFEQTGDVKRRDLDTPLRELPRDRDAAVAYFPGCTRLTSDDDGIRKDRAALARVLGAQIAACDPPPRGGCCGYPLFADGQLDLLEAHLEKLWASMKGHDLVITPDPGCAYVLSVVRKSLGIGDDGEGPEVLPLVEVLAQNADAFEGAANGLTLRYHDPCYLGRRGRTFEAPRALLQAATGQAVAEFAMHREHADCSGAGGLYPTSAPEASKEVARRRATLDPNAHQAVDAVVTACPSAKRNFERAGVTAVDIVDVLLGEHGLGGGEGA
jgi:Fe-S oxidoreductase